MSYNFYNFKLSEAGGSIYPIASNLNNERLMKSGDGVPFFSSNNMHDGHQTKMVSSSKTPDDDFTGADGDAPESYRWTVIAGNPRIENNQLKFDIDSGDNNTANWDGIRSNFRISNDFDLRCKLINQTTSIAGGGIRMYLLEYPSGATLSRINMYRDASFWKLQDRIYVSGSYAEYSENNRTNKNIRIVRIGTTLTIYHLDGGSWVSKISRAGVSLSTIYIKIEAWQYGHLPGVISFLDDFEVISETIDW
jgi:hypothetical protein